MRTFRLTAACVTAGLTFAAVSAVVFTAPAAQAQQSAVPSNAASSWQTNGPVSAIAAVGGVVYLGGDFTSVRPPGAAAGSQETPRNHFAAFSASTGALITSFNHNVNGAVRAIETSPDGKTVYLGGTFTAVDGATRNHVAAVTTSTGALSSWAPNVNDVVTSIAATNSAVYIAGGFKTAAGKASLRLAQLNATTGAAVAGFTASADAYVYSIALSTDATRLYVAGTFTALNGDTSNYAAGVVDAATGAVLPMPGNSVIPQPSAGCTSVGKTVRTDANGAYFGNEGSGGGCFDGTFAVNNDGSLKWVSHCLGATQGIQPLKGMLYVGSHAHDCAVDTATDPDAFPEVGWSKGLARHLLARSLTDGKVGSWYPNTDGGTGSSLGPRTIATDGTQLFVGGEFTKVNNVGQQGFTRFSPSTGDLSVPGTPVAPTTVARAGSKVSVFVQAPLDNDDTDLTVRLYRDGGTTPIATKDVHSVFWRQPIVAFADNAQAVGSSHTYRADAIEKNGTNASAKSGASTAVKVVSTVSSYDAAVLASNPATYWGLDDVRAPALADSSDALEGGTTFGGVTFGQPGAIDGTGTAVVTDGVTGSFATTDKITSPSTFSVETWFKTTSTTGGKIIGFGDRQRGYDFGGNSAVSGSYDKHVYMTNDGRLIFGVYNGSTDTVTSPSAYNDGAWHQVVATQGSGGMSLYVDGVRQGRNGVTTNQQYDGFWRVGGDNLGGWPSQPASNFFAGSIDDVSIFNQALTATDVRNHYTASGRPAPPSNLPTDAYGVAVNGDQPSSYWRVDETSGTIAADASDNGNTGTYVGGVTQGVAGAIGAQGTAATLDGSTGNIALSGQRSGPAAFSTELWFRTSTTSGGKIVGFGDAQTGTSGSYDKQVYMTNDGRLIFGNYNGGFDTVKSTDAYNNDQWHYLVATQGVDGMKLYVDDVLLGDNPATTNQPYSGYWRVGGDNLNAWPEQPSSSYFAGSIDEVAIYDAALSAQRIDAHYTAAGHQGPDVIAPTTAITSPTQGQTLDAGTVVISADAADNVGVTSVDFQVDNVTVGSDSSKPYTYSWTATDGARTLRTIAHDAAGNTATSTVVDVSVVTPDTTKPTVAITKPAENATVSGPTPVEFTATDDHGVTSVDLNVDGVKVDTDGTAPYSLSWNATGAGSHTLTVVATDAAGNSATSAPVNVTVPAPADTTAPTASITSPANGAAVSGAVTVTATAADNVGVTSVTLNVDGNVVGSPDTTAPYSFTWNATGTGSHTLTVTAVDAAGNSTTSAPVQVTVGQPADTTPPSAPGTLTATTAGTTSISLAWGAATDDTAVTGYKVVRNATTLPGTVTGLSYTDTGLTAGTAYSYKVYAVDAAGNAGPSSNAATATTTAANTSLYSTSFTAADGSAWPTGWVTTGTNGTATVQSNTGELAVSDVSGAYSRAALTAAPARADSDLLTSFRWSSTTAAAYLNVWLRGSGGWQNSYRMLNGYGLQLQSNSGTVQVQKNVNGTLTTLATVTGAQQITTAKQWLRVRVSGSSIQFKIWTDGQAEPTAWKSSVTDSSVTANGQPFLTLNRSSSNTGVKQVRIDDVVLNAA